MKKLSAPTAVHLTFAEVLKRFEHQVKRAPLMGQRPHLHRISAGLAKHLRTTCPTQGVLQAVEAYVGTKRVEFGIADGYHRISMWADLNYCPFNKLLLVTHRVEGRTALEAADRARELMRNMDSAKSVKRASDFYSAAVQYAGVVPKSNAYAVGARAATYFRNALGDAAKVNDRELVEAALREIKLHTLMDDLFSLSEDRHLVTPKQAQILFSPGAQMGIFNALKNRNRLPATLRNVLHDGFLLACDSKAVSRKTCLPEAVAFAKVLKKICNEANHHAIRATKGQEGLYKVVAEQLSASLAHAFIAIVPKARLRAVV